MSPLVCSLSIACPRIEVLKTLESTLLRMCECCLTLPVYACLMLISGTSTWKWISRQGHTRMTRSLSRHVGRCVQGMIGSEDVGGEGTVPRSCSVPAKAFHVF